MSKVRFPSEEWVKELEKELNSSQAYADAAKNWEGDFYFVISPDKDHQVQETTYLYMDLWRGKCREAYLVKDKDAKQPAFIMSGPYSKWQRVVTAQLDPLQGLMTGQLKLKGNMVMVMKNVKAAQEMVKACTRIDAEFLSE
ncbi:MAG: SCP2 sterol-binding domain-containing protein [Anaerolineae bacterium]|nr:SCP2 sterol-binding domain-containing protein [Anaerolineae bacterium]